MNEKNLIPFSERTESEVREMNSRGGKKSGETRRRKKALKTILKNALDMEITDVDIYNATASMGFDPNDMSYGTAVIAAMIHEAACGNVKAFQAIINLTGEDSNGERLKLMKRELSLKEKSKAPQAGETEIPQLYNALEADDDDV